MKEVKMALLEADVNFKVVKQFVNSVTERAIGQDVMQSLTPGQMVIKIVNEEMVSLMGSETTEIAFRKDGKPTVIMMVGLQGAGKTTTTAKIAGKLKEKARDLYLWPVMFTDLRQSNSYRLMVRNRKFLFLIWVRTTSRSILPKLQ